MNFTQNKTLESFKKAVLQRFLSKHALKRWAMFNIKSPELDVQLPIRVVHQVWRNHLKLSDAFRNSESACRTKDDVQPENPQNAKKHNKYQLGFHWIIIIFHKNSMQEYVFVLDSSRRRLCFPLNVSVDGEWCKFVSPTVVRRKAPIGTSAASPRAAMRSERLFCALFYFSRVNLWYKRAIKSSSGRAMKWQRSRRIDFQLVTGGFV